MSREEWVKFIESNPPNDLFILKYCEYKGKSKNLAKMLIVMVMQELGYEGLFYLKDEAYRKLSEEFGFTKLTNKEGNIIKIY